MELGSTLEQQAALERVVSGIYAEAGDADSLVLRREAHARYLLSGLRHLSAGHCGACRRARAAAAGAHAPAARSAGCQPPVARVLDHAQPGAARGPAARRCAPADASPRLLSRVLKKHAGYAADAVAFLSSCRAPTGGFGGGPGQQAHLATTYAACAALCTLGGADAVAALDRPSLLRFLLRLKLPAEQARPSLHAPSLLATAHAIAQGGGFCMTEGGEADTRGCYTALAAARMAGLLSPALTAGVGGYLSRCQTYEGGLGGEPHAEAHGGYTFCGLAAAVLAGEAAALDLPRLLHWAAQRQGAPEGGFNGRTNKLVDGCYSLWQGGVFPLLQMQLPLLTAQLRAGGSAAPPLPVPQPPASPPPPPPPHRTHAAALFPSEPGAGPAPLPPRYNARALQGWLLACCQASEGGLRDKPGKPRDFYHTCYCLSGLASAQHHGGCGLVGPPANLLAAADPVLNVATARLDAWLPLLEAQPAA